MDTAFFILFVIFYIGGLAVEASALEKRYREFGHGKNKFVFRRRTN